MKSVSVNGFRPGQVAKVIGVCSVKPKSLVGDVLKFRPCLKVKYSDGIIDYFPISEIHDRNIIVGTLTEIVSERISV